MLAIEWKSMNRRGNIKCNGINMLNCKT